MQPADDETCVFAAAVWLAEEVVPVRLARRLQDNTSSLRAAASYFSGSLSQKPTFGTANTAACRSVSGEPCSLSVFFGGGLTTILALSKIEAG